MWIYTSIPPYAFMAYCLLLKDMDNFTFYIYHHYATTLSLLF
jgi:hypothetical protein